MTKLTQEELDAFYRQDFLDQIFGKLLPGFTLRFVVQKNHLSLVTLCYKGAGLYEFSVGDQHKYTYRMSDFVHALEQLFDKDVKFLSLKGEIELDVRRVMADTSEGDE